MHNLSLNPILKRSNYHRPLLFNSVLWFLAFVILLFIFSKGQKPIKVDYLYTIAFLIALAVPALINFYILIPKFLKQEKYVLYMVLFILNLISFGLLGSWILQPILDTLFSSYFFISYLDKANVLLVFSIFLIASTLLKLAEDWFYFNRNQNKLLRIKNQQIETQLSALRAQINPHFLFNSLNVIYALALDKNEGITKAIVQLSDILRYVIYDADTEGVTLKDEIKLIQNYIAFQSHRLDTTNATTLEINIENEQFKIYPMLLLPLIENSYKHGIISGDTKTPIVIKLNQNKNVFIFSITNDNLNTDNTIKEKYAGIGLENIKNNLKLVYPNKHLFEITKTDELFKVSLKITNEA